MKKKNANFTARFNRIAVIAGVVFVVIFLLGILLVTGVILFANFSLDGFDGIAYMLAGIVIIPACLILLVRLRRQFMLFCHAYKTRGAVKHEPKVMLRSLIKFVAVVFGLTLVSSFPLGIFIIPMLPVYVIIAHCAFKYAKLWKYHGYSVLILAGFSAAAIAAAVLLSPLSRAGMQAVIAWIR